MEINKGVSPISGVAPPKEYQFGQKNGNPRHNGAWKKESTPRYKLEKMMTMTEEDLISVAADKNAPYFERKLASAINKGDWKVIESMINQVYGSPDKTIKTKLDEGFFKKANFNFIIEDTQKNSEDDR